MFNWHVWGDCGKLPHFPGLAASITLTLSGFVRSLTSPNSSLLKSVPFGAGATDAQYSPKKPRNHQAKVQ